LSDDEDAKRGRAQRKPRPESMIEDMPAPDPRKPSAALDEARLRQQAIGVRLRQMFDEVVNEDVPDEFLEILRRHDAKTTGGGGEKDG
jgi:hypothetical protein